MTDLKRIFRTCELEMDVDLTTRNNKKHFVFRRWIYFKISRELAPSASLSRVGFLADRDHATVLFGLKKFPYDILKNEYWNKVYSDCKTQCQLALLASSRITLTEIERLTLENIDLHSKINELKAKLYEQTQ